MAANQGCLQVKLIHLCSSLVTTQFMFPHRSQNLNTNSGNVRGRSSLSNELQWFLNRTNFTENNLTLIKDRKLVLTLKHRKIIRLHVSQLIKVIVTFTSCFSTCSALDQSGDVWQSAGIRERWNMRFSKHWTAAKYNNSQQSGQDQTVYE